MGYTALYRKFRPLKFEEMVGQEHITKTLKNQIMADRVGHAYLFNGGRGTGKTSAAKILARAINCLNPQNGEPCNECEICKSILEGSLTDVVEMDAASNNSVEDIRAIKEEVNFLPTLAKYRVYIIDEVHMLSTGAFNALLKTLEEPPSHVKFILATTEQQKLPATILSRCQKFDFKKISNENIIKRLEIVCEESKVEITKEALNIIAILSEGAMRDALSILERCLQEASDKIDENMIKELVGIPKLEHINQLAKTIIEGNIEQALITIDTILNEGKDINNLIWELVKYIKDILIYKVTRQKQLYSETQIDQINDLSQNISKDKLINIINDLSQLENEIKWSSQKTILFQAGIIKICTSTDNDGIQELRKKVQELQEQISSGKFTKMQTEINQQISTQSSYKNNLTNTTQKSTTSQKNIDTSKIKCEDYWQNVLEQLKQTGKMILYSNLINTKAKQVNDMTVEIIFLNGLTPFGKSALEKPENTNEIKRIISMECGKEMNIKFVDAKEHLQKMQEQSIEDKVKDLDIPVNIVE